MSNGLPGLPTDATVDRRAFLERMTALTATAALTPVALVSSRPGPAAAGDTPALRSELPKAGMIQATEPADLTVVEAAQLIRERDLSAEELVQSCLDRIDRWDGDYRAFNLVLDEEALASARRTAAAPGGARTPLAGVPLAIKDNFYTAGVPTTANSYLFEDFVPAFDATAWARLRDAGAILLGKTQMGPLATTAATTPDGERTTVNAWSPFDDDVSPGGSSSGTATSVAARMAACGTGTQTGGSITNPSNAQGLTGIKPTMGRVSLQGILPLTYTRDHVGPLARDARDAALMLQIMAGPDAADPRSLGLPPVPDYVAATEPPRGSRELRWPTRIGVWPGYLDDPTPPPARDREQQQGDRVGSTPPRAERGQEAFARRQVEVEARREMLTTLEAMGAELIEIDEPSHWSTLTGWPFNNVRLPERSEIFLEHLRRDVRGFGVSLSPWINGLLLPGAEYVRGQRARLVLLKSILDDVFSRCDVVVQTAPFPFDMVGLPLIAFPIGFEAASTAGPRPIGALFGGLPYAEDRLLALAAGYQRATDWHRRQPAEPDSFERPPSGRRRSRIDAMDVMELAE
ncbi:MAG: amidase [Gemmatimonadota bacterium]|nr:amidase [Gemmatimonadota bacterium]